MFRALCGTCLGMLLISLVLLDVFGTVQVINRKIFKELAGRDNGRRRFKDYCDLLDEARTASHHSLQLLSVLFASLSLLSFPKKRSNIFLYIFSFDIIFIVSFSSFSSSLLRCRRGGFVDPSAQAASVGFGKALGAGRNAWSWRPMPTTWCSSSRAQGCFSKAECGRSRSGAPSEPFHHLETFKVPFKCL